MYPVIHLYGLNIYMFNLCVILAVIVSILFFVEQTKNVFEAAVQDTCIALFGADIPFIIAGAILHNKIVYARSFRDFVHLLHQNTGIAFFGGFIGGFVGFVILYQVMLRRKIPMKRLMDLLAPPIMLGHAIGRIGCLMGGCCFGKPFPFGVGFAEGTPAYRMYGAQTLFPSQLVEAFALMGLFACAQKMKKHQAEFYLISYSILRFWLEFMRGDYRGDSGFLLSPAQMIAVCIVCLCVTGIVVEPYIDNRIEQKK